MILSPHLKSLVLPLILPALVGCHPVGKWLTTGKGAESGTVRLAIRLPASLSVKGNIDEITTARVIILRSTDGSEVTRSDIAIANRIGNGNISIPAGNNYAIHVQGLEASEAIEGELYGYIPTIRQRTVTERHHRPHDEPYGESLGDTDQ